jgi:hypothetical protein
MNKEQNAVHPGTKINFIGNKNKHQETKKNCGTNFLK